MLLFQQLALICQVLIFQLVVSQDQGFQQRMSSRLLVDSPLLESPEAWPLPSFQAELWSLPSVAVIWGPPAL